MTEGESCLRKFDALEKYLTNKIEALEKLLNEREQHNIQRFLTAEKAAELALRSYERQSQSMNRQIEVNTNRLTQIETSLSTRKEGLGITGVLVLGGFAALGSIVSVITLIVHIYK